MKDYYFDPDTGDLTLTTQKDLQFTADIVEYTIQKIQKVFNTFLGEWYLNRDIGIPYIALKNNDRDDSTKNIFVKNPNLPFINNLFILKLNEISTIQQVVSFNSELNTSTREFFISYEVKLIDDQTLTTENQGIGIL